MGTYQRNNAVTDTAASDAGIDATGASWILEQISMNDDFGDASFDTNRWTDNSLAGATLTESGGTLNSSNATNAAYAIAQADFKLSGNFNVQVNYQSIVDTIVPITVGRYYAYLLMEQDASNNKAYISRRHNTDGVERIFSGISVGGVPTYNQADISALPQTQASGKFKIIRSGTAITTHYWNTEVFSWVQLGSVASAFTGDAAPALWGCYVAGSPTSGSCSSGMDDFIVNSGTQVGGYYQSLNTFSLDELYVPEIQTLDCSTLAVAFAGTGSYEIREKHSVTASGGGTYTSWLTEAQFQALSDFDFKYLTIELRLVSATAYEDAEVTSIEIIYNPYPPVGVDTGFEPDRPVMVDSEYDFLVVSGGIIYGVTL